VNGSKLAALYSGIERTNDVQADCIQIVQRIS